MSAIPTEPPRSELIDTLIDAPERYVDTSYNMIFSITDEQRERLWIEGARRRFAEMRGSRPWRRDKGSTQSRHSMTWPHCYSKPQPTIHIHYLGSKKAILGG